MQKNKIKIIWLSLLLALCLTVLLIGYAAAEEPQQPPQDSGTQFSGVPEGFENQVESEVEEGSENLEESDDKEAAEGQEESKDKEDIEDQEKPEVKEGSDTKVESEDKEDSEDTESEDKEDSKEGSENEEDSQEESEDEESSGDQEDTTSGVKVDAGEGDDIQVCVSGDISVEGDGSTAIDAESEEEGKFEIDVIGSVSAEGDEAEAIDTEVTSDATGLIFVGGNVKAEGDESSAIDAEAADGGDVTIIVGESVKAEGEDAEAIDVETQDDGTISIYVAGDVTGTSTGLIATAEDEEGAIHVSVGGTISGDDQPVLVSGDGIEEALELVVWKIELDEDGNAVLEKTEEDENPEKTDLSEAIEKKIQYIIKYDQPSGGWIDLAGTTWEDGYNVAYEGDTVVMKISVKPGYALLAAYNGMGEKVTLYQDWYGNYYVIVPKGGGVYLTADLVYIGFPVKAKIPFHVGTMKQAEHLLGFVAQEEQFFSEEGLDTKIILFEEAVSMAEALEKGQIGAAFMDTTAAISLQEEDHDLIIFGGARADESLEAEESICIVAYAPTFQANPKTYKAFEEAILKAFDYYQEEHGETILDIRKYTEETEELIEQVIYSEESYISPDPDLLGIEETEKVKFDDSVYQKALND